MKQASGKDGGGGGGEGGGGVQQKLESTINLDLFAGMGEKQWGDYGHT